MKRIRIYRLALLMLALTALAVVEAQARTLHLVIVTQNDDPRIGPSKDKENIDVFAEKLTRATRLELRKYYMKRSDLDGQAFREAINNVDCGGDDAVWFHYSGHGRNYDGWPGFPLGQTVSQSKIHEAFKRKGARLVVSTFDCCNVGGGAVRNANCTFPRTPPAMVTNYAQLFVEAEGDVKACSSQPRQASWGSPETGGFFTTSFLQAIDVVSADTQQATWEQVMDKAVELTEQLARSNERRQRPQYQINARKGDVELQNFPEEDELSTEAIDFN